MPLRRPHLMKFNKAFPHLNDGDKLRVKLANFSEGNGMVLKVEKLVRGDRVLCSIVRMGSIAKYGLGYKTGEGLLIHRDKIFSVFAK